MSGDFDITRFRSDFRQEWTSLDAQREASPERYDEDDFETAPSALDSGFYGDPAELTQAKFDDMRNSQ